MTDPTPDAPKGDQPVDRERAGADGYGFGRERQSEYGRGVSSGYTGDPGSEGQSGAGWAPASYGGDADAGGGASATTPEGAARTPADAGGYRATGPDGSADRDEAAHSSSSYGFEPEHTGVADPAPPKAR